MTRVVARILGFVTGALVAAVVVMSSRQRVVEAVPYSFPAPSDLTNADVMTSDL